MRGPVVAVLALAGVVFGDASAWVQRGRGDPRGSRYGWLSSLEAGKAQARSSGKPLMVVLRCVP